MDTYITDNNSSRNRPQESAVPYYNSLLHQSTTFIVKQTNTRYKPQSAERNRPKTANPHYFNPLRWYGTLFKFCTQNNLKQRIFKDIVCLHARAIVRRSWATNTWARRQNKRCTTAATTAIQLVTPKFSTNKKQRHSTLSLIHI